MEPEAVMELGAIGKTTDQLEKITRSSVR